MRLSGSAFRRIKKAVKSYISFMRYEVFVDARRDEIEASKYEMWESDTCNFSETRPICMLAHYAADDTVNENLLSYVRALTSCGIDIVLISACEHMPKEQIDRALEYCSAVITRKNIGYDFYSWKIGCLAYPEYATRPAMLWLNDSVLVEEKGVPRIVKTALSSSAGLFGLTDCFRHGHHLQSYFLRFSHSVITSREFRDFLGAIAVHRNKPTVIRLYEVGLSRKIGVKAGVESMIKTRDLHRADGGKPLRRLNPTIDTWKELIERYALPFAKKELITKRGVPIEDIRTSFARIKHAYPPGAANV